ncbi:hypothetical protein DNU06_15520 [Putridiphycobacter roseus]|uniref:Lipoprotein n=1 Tax=Putridiphycobacter roseus TaxID=2219161 RepID=A0A2W1NCX0_9FLAO|nr:hypothetical protein [Putridiphycobacter roseus]PZE15916.1 hypothetical protein DNU06_15520 [Putridiphycobacter roseus]
MRPALNLLIIITLLGCSNSEQQNTVESSRIALVPEPDKHLREKYENKITDLSASDTIILTESLKIEDEPVNEYLTEELKPIRKNFKRINSIIKWTAIQHAVLWETTEGGQVEFYYNEETLEKIIVRHFGEISKYLAEYYLIKGELSFVFEKSYNYNRPIYWDSTSMKEISDNQIFDIEASEIIEERSYFHKNELIHQLSNLDCGAPFADDYLKKEQQRVQSEFKRLLELKKAPNNIYNK